MAWYDSWEEAVADVVTGGAYSLTKATATVAAATAAAADKARVAAGLTAAAVERLF